MQWMYKERKREGRKGEGGREGEREGRKEGGREGGRGMERDGEGWRKE